MSRRAAGAAAVLGVSLLACYAQVEHLSSTGEELVVLMPTTSYDFGTLALNQGSATIPDPYFTVRAQSATDDDQVTVAKSSTCGGDFKLDLQPPLPGSAAHVYCAPVGAIVATSPGNGSTTPMCSYVDYQFGATFTPTQSGMQTCPVIVTSTPTAGGSATQYTITLTGTGQGSSYSMDVQPKTLLDFGDVPLNSSTGDQPVTVTNTGSTPIDVTSSNSDPVHFLSNPLMGTSVSLAPQSSKTFQVHCQAGPSAGLYSATFSFSTPSTEGSLSGMVSARCNAIAANVSVSPNPIDLGTHLLGDAPTMRSVTITNNSGATVTLDNYALPGAPTGEVSFPGGTPAGFDLPGGGQALITVEYAPTTERDVGPMGTLQFTASGVTVNTPLRGGAHVGSIGTNPGMFDFGTVCAGSTKSLDMAVFANAGGDVTLSGTSGPTAPFSAALPAMGRTLLGHHGSEITLSAMAAPAGSATPGDVNDMVTLQTNIPNLASIAIPMHAAVLAGGVAPTPAIAHFGPNELGKPSAAQAISVTNCSTSDFTISDASFTGANPGEFSIVSPGDPHVMIKQTESAQFLVVMTAQSAGPKSAQLVVTYPGGTTTVDLDGTGIGSGDTGGGKDRETYYACSVGSAPGMLPIALAAFAARRRRSRTRRAR